MTAGLVTGAFACCGPQHAEPVPADAAAETRDSGYLPEADSASGESAPAAADVIDRLDAIDGVRDGSYTNLSLHITNTTGVCEVAFKVMDAAPPCIDSYRVQMVNMMGQIVDVDCVELFRKLGVLVDIAQRNPTARFLAEKKSGGATSQHLPGAEEYLGYNIADHMISALLLGVATTSESFSELFGEVTFGTYSEVIRGLGRDLNRPDYKAMDVRDAKEGYVVFQRLGKRYGFDAAPFRPKRAVFSNDRGRIDL